MPFSRAWYGVDEHRGIDCTQEVQQLVNGGSTVRAENGLVSYDPAPFTRKVLKTFFEVEVEEGSSWTRRRGRRWSSMRSKINFPNRLWAMKNDPCSAKHRMPFLQIFADQLSQTAASLPGANVRTHAVPQASGVNFLGPFFEFLFFVDIFFNSAHKPF